MGILKKAVEKLDEAADKRIETVVEKALGPKPEPKPDPKPKFRTDSSVVIPTRGAGGSCSLSLAKLAALLGSVVTALVLLAGCDTPVQGTPTPRAPYSEDADQPDYVCQYDGNHRCPTDGSVNR